MEVIYLDLVGGGLHVKHAVATWKRNGNRPSICV